MLLEENPSLKSWPKSRRDEKIKMAKLLLLKQYSFTLMPFYFSLGRKKVEVLLQQMFEVEILDDESEERVIKPRTVTLDSIT